MGGKRWRCRQSSVGGVEGGVGNTAACKARMLASSMNSPVEAVAAWKVHHLYVKGCQSLSWCVCVSALGLPLTSGFFWNSCMGAEVARGKCRVTVLLLLC